MLTYAIPKLYHIARHRQLLSPTRDITTDYFRKTYNSDRFESVTKPASWSMLGSAGEDAICVSLFDERPTHSSKCVFDILSF